MNRMWTTIEMCQRTKKKKKANSRQYRPVQTSAPDWENDREIKMNFECFNPDGKANVTEGKMFWVVEMDNETKIGKKKNGVMAPLTTHHSLTRHAHHAQTGTCVC